MEGGERAPVLTEASCLIIASSIVGPVDHQEALASVMDLGHGVPPVVGIGHHLRLSDERAAVPRQPQHPARTVAKIRGGGDNHHGPTAWAPPRLEVGGSARARAGTRGTARRAPHRTHGETASHAGQCDSDRSPAFAGHSVDHQVEERAHAEAGVRHTATSAAVMA